MKYVVDIRGRNPVAIEADEAIVDDREIVFVRHRKECARYNRKMISRDRVTDDDDPRALDPFGWFYTGDPVPMFVGTNTGNLQGSSRDIEPGLWQVSMINKVEPALCIDEIISDSATTHFRYGGKCILGVDNTVLQGYRRVEQALLLVKFVPCREWADAHRDAIHMQLVSKYYEIEKDTPGGKYDRYEGGVAVGHESIELSLSTERSPDEKVVINTERDLLEPMLVRYTAVEDLYMTCYSCVPFSYSEDSRIDGRFDDKFWEIFGHHAVVITKPDIFLERVWRAATKEGYDVVAGSVQYYKQPNLPDISDYVDTLFCKRVEYAWQREYRIVLGSKAQRPLPQNLLLRVDLRGIGGIQDHRIRQ